MKTMIDNAAAYELKLFADNDYQTYSKMYMPVCDNLRKKMDAGKYDSDKAIKAFEYVAEFAAKKYCKEFGGVWYQVFNKATRTEVAKNIRDTFENE